MSIIIILINSGLGNCKLPRYLMGKAMGIFVVSQKAQEKSLDHLFHKGLGVFF